MFFPMPLIAGAVVVLAVVGSVNAASMMRTKTMKSITVSSNAELSSSTVASVTGLPHSTLMRTKQIEHSSSFPARYEENPNDWNAYWGGLEHASVEKDENGNAININGFNRPEWMKLRRCTQSRCEECSGTELCWHGVPGNKGRGAINIHTLQGQENNFVNFTMIAHAKCKDKFTMKFRVKNDGLEGGNLKFYWGIEEQNVSALTWKTKLRRSGGKVESIIWDKKFTQQDINELQIVWIPDPSQSSSNASLQVWLQDVSEAFTECQDKKVCLAMLDDHLGMQLREKNELMRQCLQDDLRQYLNSGLQEKCNEWLDCLTGGYVKLPYWTSSCPTDTDILSAQGCTQAIDNLGIAGLKPMWTGTNSGIPRWCSVRETGSEPKGHFAGNASGGVGRRDLAPICYKQVNKKEKMLTLLKAAKVDEVRGLVPPASVLVEVEKSTDKPGCLLPVFEDIPSWQCDCYEKMETTCNNDYSGMNLAKCLTMLACCSDKVCESWKLTAKCHEDHCSTTCKSRAKACDSSASLLLRNDSQSLLEQRGSAHQNNKQQERPSTLQSHTSPPEHNSASLQSLLEVRKTGSATQQEDHRAFEESLSGKELC